MKRLVLTILSFIIYFCLNAIPLQTAFELASAGEGYDKVIVLDNNEVYTGGLIIGNTYNNDQLRLEEEVLADVKIVGNGAVIDLQGEQLCISYCNNRLDIDDCVIINGTVRFRAIEATYNQRPEGSVTNCTIYNAIDYGLKTQYCGQGILFENNIIMNTIGTGEDFIFLTGEMHEWILTGLNLSGTVQAQNPEVKNNWSYFSDEEANSDSLHHFASL